MTRIDGLKDYSQLSQSFAEANSFPLDKLTLIIKSYFLLIFLFQTYNYKVK